jgi:segregation and condensation protein B
MDNVLRIFSPGDAALAETRTLAVRITEALLFASAEPLSAEDIALNLPKGSNVLDALATLQHTYAARGVELVQVAGKWMFRTAGDLGYLLNKEASEPRKLSRAALETLSIVAYHQPATRAEIEEIRGVSTAKGTLDVLMELGWVRMRGRRKSPGRPVTYGTTEAFLVHFGLASIEDMPGLDELKGAGLFDTRVQGLTVPSPSDNAALRPDEEPMEMDIFDAMQEARIGDHEPELDPGDGRS